MATWRVRLLDSSDVPQQWIGEAADGNEAEAKALEAYPDSTIKSGTEI